MDACAYFAYLKIFAANRGTGLVVAANPLAQRLDRARRFRSEFQESAGRGKIFGWWDRWSWRENHRESTCHYWDMDRDPYAWPEAESQWRSNFARQGIHVVLPGCFLATFTQHEAYKGPSTSTGFNVKLRMQTLQQVQYLICTIWASTRYIAICFYISVRLYIFCTQTIRKVTSQFKSQWQVTFQFFFSKGSPFHLFPISDHDLFTSPVFRSFVCCLPCWPWLCWSLPSHLASWHLPSEAWHGVAGEASAVEFGHFLEKPWLLDVLLDDQFGT